MKHLASYVTRGNAPILLIFALLGITMCCSNALAQSGAGSIQGTVQDATHAVIPGASIRVVNTATGVVSTTKSNKVGFYQVPGLFTGLYTVTVSAPGMKIYKTSIQLLVAQNAVISPVMTPGAVTQQVVVSGNAVQLVTTDNGTINDTLDNARINQLPENGRDITTLVGMATPGIFRGATIINGLEPEALAYTVDGVATMDTRQGGELYHGQQLLDPDSVRAVRMDTVDTGANFGTPSSVMVSTKSGTNALHGTFFWTARNNAIGIAKGRQDPSNFSAPHYVRNEAGGSVGGPIVLPHIYNGKNKSFFFFAYERYSLAQDSAVLSKVPTIAMSQGDFSGLIDKKGILQTLYDPATTANSAKCAATKKANPYCRTPFANNQIPIGEESPLAKIYYQLVPLPTSSADPLVAPNNTSLNPELQITPQVTFRLDQNFNENNRAYLRYTQNLTGINLSGGPRNRAADGIPVGAAGGRTTYYNQPVASYLAAIGYTHIFSPTFFSETVASQQWFSEAGLPGADAVDRNSVDYESMLGLPNNYGEKGFPSVGNGKLIFSLGSSQNQNFAHSQIISTLDENLTKVIGRHQLLFGGRFQHVRLADAVAGVQDVSNFNNFPTGVYDPKTGANYGALKNTGYADASFFLGSATAYSVNLEPPVGHDHTNEFDAYIQDNYHVGRNLTLNLGLRYEAHPASWAKYGVANSFDLKNDALVLAVPPSTLISEGYTTPYIIANLENVGVKIETPAEAGMPANTLLRNYNLNFLPRGGIAYLLFGGRHGTVIRGGYGRYIVPMPMNDYAEHSLSNVPLIFKVTQNYGSAAQAIDGLPGELLRYNDPVKFGVAGLNIANVVNTATGTSILPGSFLANNASPDSPPAFTTETNLTLEQTLKGNSALRVSWIWTHSTNLFTRDVYNNHPSTYQWEMATGTVPPTGGASVIGTPQQNTYAATATGPYDQTTWGGNILNGRNGWSNDNEFQINYQRLFHHGIAYQIWYAFSKPMRFGGNTNENHNNKYLNNEVFPDANFPGVMGTAATMIPAYGPVYPGVPPPVRPAGLPVWADWHAMDKYQEYQLDPEVPIHNIEFNGIVDLPFGRGERFFSHVNGFWNEVIGGFQLAGAGNITSQNFQLTADLQGPTTAFHIYKHRHPITDCRSGVCYKAYLWDNGYLGPTS